MNRRVKYAASDLLNFEDGDIIEIDTNYFGIPEDQAEYVEGEVIGKYSAAMTNQVYWIVDFGEIKWLSNKKYRAMIVPQNAICKKNEGEITTGSITVKAAPKSLVEMINEMSTCNVWFGVNNLAVTNSSSSSNNNELMIGPVSIDNGCE